MRVLFVGPHWYGSNATSMANGLVAAGCTVRVVDTTPLARPRPLTPAWLSAKAPGAPLPDPGLRVLEQIQEVARHWRPDMLFAFKTVRLPQEDLLALDVPLKVHYSPDDISNPENITYDYLRHESQWDLIVTTKRHNLAEVAARSAVASLFVWSAYDPAWHHPMASRGDGRSYRLGFIGNARPDRLDFVERLARRFRRDMLLCGERWWRARPALLAYATLRGPAYGEAFSSAVSDVHANLVLLNSENRDQHTCRSFEVPAAGGLAVAERTPEHAEILDDGVEALFFSGEEELLDILARLRADGTRLDRLRTAGYRRITEGGHTYSHRASEILGRLR